MCLYCGSSLTPKEAGMRSSGRVAVVVFAVVCFVFLPMCDEVQECEECVCEECPECVCEECLEC
ncbi:MAG: hypothetical protein U9P90_00560, partial [Patescibacteria group bacterium]|nr:hypothetical protein [Patescibacteria group bacterium]